MFSMNDRAINEATSVISPLTKSIASSISRSASSYCCVSMRQRAMLLISHPRQWSSPAFRAIASAWHGAVFGPPAIFPRQAFPELARLRGDEVRDLVKQQLEMDARRLGGMRLLPGRFMVIEQAMGVPKGRTAAQAWLSGFIEEMKASGFVADALKRHRIEGAAVAPPRAT